MSDKNTAMCNLLFRGYIESNDGVLSLFQAGIVHAFTPVVPIWDGPSVKAGREPFPIKSLTYVRL
jgi:hypothetical protein